MVPLAKRTQVPWGATEGDDCVYRQSHPPSDAGVQVTDNGEGMAGMVGPIPFMTAGVEVDAYMADERASQETGKPAA
jgi:hypothetical protein